MEQDGQEKAATQEITFDLSKILSFCKAKPHVVLLLAFMLFGFYLRSYHMDFPVIGYHNMKENQYIPYTEFMYNADEFLDYFRTETYWIGAQQHGYFTQYEFPFIPWMILLLWWIVGVKLWAARLVIILFSLASIPILYLVGKKLTDNVSLVLVACLFFTIMPISIFFGRNVQPEAPAVFLILLGTYWFLRWREDVLASVYHYKKFLYFSLCFLLAILLKVPNGIGLVPLLFFVPYKELFSQKKYLCILAAVFLFIMMLFPVWVKLSQLAMPGAATVGTSGFDESFAEVRTNISLALSSSYWSDHYLGIRSFVLDNFTGWFFWLTLLGVIFALLKIRTKMGLFIASSFFSLLLYIIFFADKFRGHAYYQMVFLPLVCFGAAYALFVIATILEKPLASIHFYTKFQGKLIFVFLVLLFFLSFSDLTAATSRVFDTIYYGEDIAGDFISQHSDPEDRVFIDGVFSQSVGILWHAHRYGIEEIPSNLTRFQELEDELQFRWVVLYAQGMGTIQSKLEVWEYIQQTYSIQQIGLIPQGNELAPYYFVLEKGGTFDPDSFLVNKTPYLATTYTNSAGIVEFYALDGGTP
ncbi:glycosyltransferase family 39 protein [Candidatus Woesearchaeota archaeon]|nr:glycosyltransferase family 39 protein [Candidatus Woesearchaeota archaeon]